MKAPKNFNEYEATADEIARRIVKGKPARALLTLIHAAGAIPWLCSGPDEREKHRSLGPRKAGYLLPLLKETDSKFMGSSAYDILGVWGKDEEHAEIANQLFSYADFCELAPNVHKGYLIPQIDGNQCTLTWKSSNYAAFEAKDSIISNLFNPIALHDNSWHSDWFKSKATAPQFIAIVDYHQLLHELTALFHDRYLEISTLSEDAMLSATGVSLPNFRRFRAASMALAEFQTLLLEAMRARMEEDSTIGANPEFHEEILDQIVPCYPIDYIHDLISALAQIPIADVHKLMDIYAFVSGQDEGRAEGFAPPFVTSDENYVFAPFSVQYMMSSRNVAYSCLQKHKIRFDNSVSMHLEPRLIEVATAIFGCLNDVRVVPNIKWDGGEIDLLVYREKERAVLLIEAKATVAPEGGRMIRNAESRILHGLDQLARFSAQPTTRQNQIFSDAFGHAVDNISYTSVILTWAGFGTENVWTKLGAVCPINIAMLSHIVLNHPDLKLTEFSDQTSKLINEVMEAAEHSWEVAEGQIGDLKLSFPLLNLKSTALTKYQVAPHKLFNKHGVSI
jgi:hypothetical protein